MRFSFLINNDPKFCKRLLRKGLQWEILFFLKERAKDLPLPAGRL